MKNKKAVSVFFSILFILPSAFAANENIAVSRRGEPISIHGLIDEVLTKSPAVQSKKAQYEALRSKVINAWLPEDPMVGLDIEGQPELFKTGGRMNYEYMVSQTIPFPTKLFLSGVIASKEADMAYQEYKEEERDTIWHMEQPYYELYLAQKTLKALEENGKLLEQLAKSAKARYESNQVPQQDILKAQIELSKNEIDIFNWKERVHIQQAHFSHLLNVSLDTEYVLSEKPQSVFNYAKTDLESIALTKRPELKALEVAIERAKASRSLAQSEWLPDITLRYEGRQFKGEDSISEHDTFVGVTVPFWSLIKGIGGVWKSAEDEVKVAEAIYQKMKNETLLQIHEAFSKVKSAENALKIYESSILPQSGQTVEVALASYEAGTADFLTVVDAQRTLKNAQIDYYRMLAEYEMGISNLRLAVGDDLNRGIR